MEELKIFLGSLFQYLVILAVKSEYQFFFLFEFEYL